MRSMYDTIKDLPLFKGIGTDELSQMLEKTKMEFINFETGDIIHASEDSVTSLDFLIGGKLLCIHSLENYGIKIIEKLGPGIVVGARHLYGMDTRYGCTISAEIKTSLIRITKEQYSSVLKSNEIFLINYLNFLSAAIHRPELFLKEYEGSGIGRQLGVLLKTTVNPMAEEIRIAGADTKFSYFLGVKEKEWERWKENAVNEGDILIDDKYIIINSGSVGAL